MKDRRVAIGQEPYRPIYVVWELTLACDHACAHCGSRAGKARERELNLEEALRVVDQLADAGTREVVLIGGEAYLWEGMLEVVRALVRRGVRPLMTTGGKGLSPGLCRELAEAGMYSVSVSIDGLEASHNTIRRNKRSFQAGVRALTNLREAGLRTSVNTNINRINMGDLEALYERLLGLGVRAWQVQITAPLGRAADRPEMVLQPWDLLEVMPRVIALKERGFEDGLLVMPGNNLGYFGPDEATLRSQRPDHRDHWVGCQAGRYVMGIESDGAVKGCPSLQTDSYVGGNLLEQDLQSIWDGGAELAFTRDRTVEDLWGFCRTCPFAEVCMGGCSFTAHALFGRPGNNPYCHFRARTLAARGQRERLVRAEAAPGLPFDNGRFELVVEPLDTPEPPA